MAKLTYALILVIIIEMALYFFAGTSYSQTTLFGLLNNFTGISTNTLYVALIAGLAVFAAGTIVVGSVYQINMFGVYATIATILITFSLNIVHLGIFVNGQLSDLGIPMATLITMIILTPLLITYLMATIEWVRSN